MEKMVNVFLFGKRYQVPESLTIMKAMEYAGYQLVRGCGCRNGFCGACATIYRIKGEQELKTCLACQTKVEEGMYVATLPFFPLVKQVYDINVIKPTQQIMMQLYPEIYSCIGCNACTKSCTQELNVMQYIAYAQRGEYDKCAEESFDCVMCGVCSSKGVFIIASNAALQSPASISATRLMRCSVWGARYLPVSLRVSNAT